jgi:chromosome partitioning protein
MVSTQSAASDRGPRVVVIGNHKGGSGKSTVAMHLIVALLKAGKRVASFDLDVQQRTLTHYIEYRQAWAKRNGLALELPHHACAADAGWDDPSRRQADNVRLFIRSLEKLQADFDFIVIDTPGSDDRLSRIAHGMADTLITPINDSFVDLDLIVTVGASAGPAPILSRYAEAVWAALDGRRAIGGRPTDWIVFRNRLLPLASRNNRQIGELLSLVAPDVGFRTAPGLSERVVFREFFPVGLTAFDQLAGPVLGVTPTMSHLMARVEVRELIEAIGLLPPAPERSVAPDRSSLEVTV